MFEDGKLQLIESAENKNSKTSYLALFKIMEYIKTTKVKVSSADILQTIEVVCCKATENKLKHLRNLWVCYSDGASLVGSGSKESACNAGRPRFNPLVGKTPWRRKCQPTLVFLPGELHGQRSLAGYSPWGRKQLDITK